MSRLAALWAGRLPLARAFWGWAVLGGLAVNTVASALALAALAADLPGLLALGLHLAPAPYNIVIAVGVWRSAGHEADAARWRDAARLAVVAWAVLLTWL